MKRILKYKTIYAFSDYRKYLQHIFNERKNANNSVTYKSFSQKMGLSSSQYFSLILAGKRNITTKQALLFAEYVELNYEETNYLLDLILYNQSESSIEKNHFKKILSQHKIHKNKSKEVSFNSLMFPKWYHPLIALYVDDIAIEDAYQNLYNHLGLDLQEAKEMIEKLIQANILQIVNSRFKLDFSYLVLKDNELNRLSYKSYFADQLKHSQWALKNQDKLDAKFYSHIFSIEKSKKYLFDQKIQTFLEEMTEISNAQKNETAMVMNIQLFPHAKLTEKI